MLCLPLQQSLSSHGTDMQVWLAACVCQRWAVVTAALATQGTYRIRFVLPLVF